jgi:hypothetical protein
MKGHNYTNDDMLYLEDSSKVTRIWTTLDQGQEKKKLVQFLSMNASVCPQKPAYIFGIRWEVFEHQMVILRSTKFIKRHLLWTNKIARMASRRQQTIF